MLIGMCFATGAMLLGAKLLFNQPTVFLCPLDGWIGKVNCTCMPCCVEGSVARVKGSLPVVEGSVPAPSVAITHVFPLSLPQKIQGLSPATEIQGLSPATEKNSNIACRFREDNMPGASSHYGCNLCCLAADCIMLVICMPCMPSGCAMYVLLLLQLPLSTT